MRLMAKVYTKEELMSWTPAQRLALYKNAKTRAEGKYIADMIDEYGMVLSTGGNSYGAPIHMRIAEIAWSTEGRQAALASMQAGWPAVAGVDRILQRELGEEYGYQDRLTMAAGMMVGEVMRHLGYRPTTSGPMPPGCVGKTGMRWK
jgi:hypothetical protein